MGGKIRHLLVMLVVLFAPVSAFAETVDVQLVYAADVSLSIQGTEFLLERHGFSSALMSEETIAAIQAGKHKAIAVCFIEFADQSQQKILADWTILRDEGDVATFTIDLLTAPRSFSGYASISGAIDFAVKHIQTSGITADRRIVTIMADGTNAAGRPVTAARDAAAAAGVTVDAIAIVNVAPKWKHIEHTNPKEGLAEYFSKNVIAGPGARVSVLDNVAPPTAGDLIGGHLRQEILGQQ
ncbi:MAG TPA: DUF1194 domain-containing protein [Alphaproteobacteria bacterium]|nr:DUF1194 domain-containing protein [Alphaproteobacteria bacterium]